MSGAFVFGGHLGSAAGVDQDMVFAMIVGKLMGGLTAIVLAIITTPKLLLKILIYRFSERESPLL